MNTVQNSMNQLQNTIKSGADLILENISRSPVMIGLAVLMINLGGRYIASDISQYDEKVLNNKFMKKLTIFSIAFLSTRDIKYSIIIVLLYSILFNPLGLAYKIMVKTQNSLNPFNMMNTFDLDSLNTSNLKNRKMKVNKINL